MEVGRISPAWVGGDSATVPSSAIWTGIDMDPWQAARYHQPGSVEVVRTGAAAVSTSAVWTGKNGSVAVSRISPAWVGVSQLSHLQRSGLVDMDNPKTNPNSNRILYAAYAKAYLGDSMNEVSKQISAFYQSVAGWQILANPLCHVIKPLLLLPTLPSFPWYLVYRPRLPISLSGVSAVSSQKLTTCAPVDLHKLLG